MTIKKIFKKKFIHRFNGQLIDVFRFRLPKTRTHGRVIRPGSVSPGARRVANTHRLARNNLLTAVALYARRSCAFFRPQNKFVCFVFSSAVTRSTTGRLRRGNNVLWPTRTEVNRNGIPSGNGRNRNRFKPGVFSGLLYST